ncbi:MAG TPA: cell division protein ZapE [Sphingomicrobium sp.]|nr:cell division protein ZapE [Sphingomicrobium sp.]
MSGRVRLAYEGLLARGELKADAAQQRGIEALGRLETSFASQSGGFFRLLARRRPAGPSGSYLWGPVGRGKTMLMDIGFAEIDAAPKRRVHFHAFMIETHQRLRDARKTEGGDPVEAVAERIAEEARLLAFDEMMVTNPADAMILSRLFEKLLDRGVRVIATSNRPPADLYKDGLNRELFVPFIEMLQARFEVVEINGPSDYRLDRLSGVKVWHVPNGPEATKALSDAFFKLTDYSVEVRAKVPSEELEVGGGRTLHVPKSLKGVAVFSFKRLCVEPRSAADYLAIAQRFHTVIVVGIPVMSREMRNEAARFTALIDVLYEHRVKLLASADAEPADLYPAGDGSFEFERTASRIEEMRSAEYLAAGHGMTA